MFLKNIKNTFPPPLRCAFPPHYVKTDKDGNHVIKPSMIKSYNIHMGGVDRVDQQLHGIQATRKSYKWYKKLFVRLVLQSALNSHKIFHQETGMNKVTFLDFLINTCLLYTSPSPRDKRQSRMPSSA